MSSPTYYTRLTDHGSAALNDAITGGGGITLSQLALGDANGTSYDPDGSEAALRNELHRVAITSITQDVQNPAWLVIEAIVPPDVGGWWIREAGVFDTQGNMFAIAKYPETYKAILSDGTASTLTIQIVLQITNTDAIQLVVNPLDGYATQGWVVSTYPWATKAEAADETVERKVIDPKRLHETLAEVMPPRDHTHQMDQVVGLIAALNAKSGGDHTHRYAQLEDKPTTLDELGVLDVYTKAQVDQLIADLISAAPGALNTLDELANALGDNPNFATDILNAVGAKLDANKVSAFSLTVLALTSSSAWREKLGLGSLATKSTSYVKGLVGSAVPPGTVAHYDGTSAPNGWLIRNGAAVSRATYSDLFNVIGTRHGNGNGSTTFNLPDDRGRVDRGLDLGKGLDPGRVIGSQQGDAIRNITGELWGYHIDSYVGLNAYGGEGIENGALTFTNRSTSRIAQSASHNNQSRGIKLDASRQVPTAHENRMVNTAYLPIIKY
ncbi:phage tail protein [Pseudovibrio exalbescens]|uniref:phage tail-collar fiber domain-containing protein n=1 Tax=Pseudovibrio exalbescens TaxID=197461 RepID=UPI002365B836|nr:phage tail protein [Pseudovibrio exalbescens]MDD7908650.1 phage tail protein [Pseudovibrio exalbescens]